jgi:hypothetical protein
VLAAGVPFLLPLGLNHVWEVPITLKNVIGVNVGGSDGGITGLWLGSHGRAKEVK